MLASAFYHCFAAARDRDFGGLMLLAYAMHRAA